MDSLDSAINTIEGSPVTGRVMGILERILEMIGSTKGYEGNVVKGGRGSSGGWLWVVLTVVVFLAIQTVISLYMSKVIYQIDPVNPEEINKVDKEWMTWIVSFQSVVTGSVVFCVCCLWVLSQMMG